MTSVHDDPALSAMEVDRLKYQYLELAAYLAMPPNEQKLWRVARAGAMDFPDKDDPPTPPVLWPVAGRWFTQVNSHLKLR